MPRALDPATREALAERMRFYRDLGLTEFYRRPVGAGGDDAQGLPEVAEQIHEAAADVQAVKTQPASELQSSFFGEEPDIKPRKGFVAPPEIAGAVPVEERAAALKVIREDIGDSVLDRLVEVQPINLLQRDHLAQADASRVRIQQRLGPSPARFKQHVR